MVRAAKMIIIKTIEINLRLAALILSLGLLIVSSPVFLLTILDDLFFNLVLVMPGVLGMKASESSDFSVSDFVLLSELDESLDLSGMAPKLTLEVEDEEPSSSSFELKTIYFLI